jgi:hypothetical protein
MTDEDIQTLKELASEMQCHEAVKFVRGETSWSLKEAGGFVRNIIHAKPDSKLASSYLSLPVDSGYRTLFR